MDLIFMLAAVAAVSILSIYVLVAAITAAGYFVGWLQRKR